MTGDRAFQRLVLEVANDERIQLDGALGRRQARNITGLSTPPPAKSLSPGIEITALANPPSALATKAPSRQRVLSMLGRVFHDGGWLAGDFWESGDLLRPPSRVPMRPKTVVEAPVQRPSSPQARQPSPADLARRAAALAAARRR